MAPGLTKVSEKEKEKREEGGGREANRGEGRMEEKKPIFILTCMYLYSHRAPRVKRKKVGKTCFR